MLRQFLVCGARSLQEPRPTIHHISVFACAQFHFRFPGFLQSNVRRRLPCAATTLRLDFA